MAVLLRNCKDYLGAYNMEPRVGFAPTIADLQSAALLAWLSRLKMVDPAGLEPATKVL